MKLLGGILLIVGTTIGGAMLALPIATAELGFGYSSLLLFSCWLVMTASAFLILEVNSWLPRNNNIISMAKATLGIPGQIVAWITYLLLLYSLLAAYMAGGGDFFHHLLHQMHWDVSLSFASILFTLLLGYVVYAGVFVVDYVNRVLMIAKLGAFFILIFLLFPHITPHYLAGGEGHHFANSITVCLTSFGFATLVPTLRIYFHDNKAQLKRAIVIGSGIPLICYILWNLALMGIIPREGEDGLVNMLHGGRSTSELVEQLNNILHSRFITNIAGFFTSICLATAFLGVSLGLADFLADGFGMERKGKNNFFIILLTFAPPLVIALFYPGAFVKALSYAGIYCAILVILLPALMAWGGRYHKKIGQVEQVAGGKWLLAFLIIFSVSIIFLNVWPIIKNLF